MKPTNERMSVIFAVLIIVAVSLYSCHNSPEFQGTEPLEEYQVEQIMTEAGLIINSRAAAWRYGFNECRDNLFGCLMCHEGMHKEKLPNYAGVGHEGPVKTWREE